MLKISDITELFNYYECDAEPCPVCGKRPTFVYSISHTAPCTIRLGHICGNGIDGAIIEKKFDIAALYYNRDFIKELLKEMIDEWNRGA